MFLAPCSATQIEKQSSWRAVLGSDMLVRQKWHKRQGKQGVYIYICIHTYIVYILYIP